MTNKQYELQSRLMSDKSDKLKIKALKLRLEEKQSMVDIGAICYESDGSVKQSKGNSQEAKLIKYISDVEEIKNELQAMMDKVAETERWKKQLIDTLEDSRLYAIASMLFISYLTIEKVAEIVGCEPRTVIRKKIQILELLINVIACHL